MTEYSKKRIGQFLEKHVDISPGHSYTEECVIRQGINELTSNCVYTPKGLQRQILREQSVLLPLSNIENCARYR